MNVPEFVLSEIAVPGSRVRLHHRIARPSGEVVARLLIVHGYGEHCARYGAFMEWLAQRGIASEAIDLRGHGRSTGRRGFVRRWEEYLDDLQAFLDAHHRAAAESSAPLFILGHSHGGLIVAAAGERGILPSSVAGCILSSPYLATRMSIPRIKKILAAMTHRILPWLHVATGMQGAWLTRDPAMAEQDRADTFNFRVATPRWFVTMRATQQRVMAEASSFRFPLLCIVGDADVVADPASGIEFYPRAGTQDKSLYVYPGGVHELLRDIVREEVYADILNWVAARLPSRTPENVS